MSNEFWIITSAFIAGGITAIVCDRLGYKRGTQDTLKRLAREADRRAQKNSFGTHP